MPFVIRIVAEVWLDEVGVIAKSFRQAADHHSLRQRLAPSEQEGQIAVHAKQRSSASGAMRELAKPLDSLGTIRRRQLERRFPQRGEASEFPILVAVRGEAKFGKPRDSGIAQTAQRRTGG